MFAALGKQTGRSLNTRLAWSTLRDFVSKTKLNKIANRNSGFLKKKSLLQSCNKCIQFSGKKSSLTEDIQAKGGTVAFPEQKGNSCIRKGLQLVGHKFYLYS